MTDPLPEPPTGSLTDTALTRDAGVAVPVICGAMFPCSNPELVAAASAAGGLGMIQPVSLTFVHGHDFREGLRYIRSLTDEPVGMNALIEQSSKRYHERMVEWIDIALEEGVRFFITALGKPDWVVEKVHAVGGVVYHNVTERKWAMKGCDSGVDGLIAVNRRAGGHAGEKSAEALLQELGDLGLPVVHAGGIANGESVRRVIEMGYAGVQMGTRFIATTECTAADSYKRAICEAQPDDVVLTERLTGVPVAVLNTPHVQRIGTKAGPMARWMLRGGRTKHWMRSIYAVRSLLQLRRTARRPGSPRDYWQAGKSVGEIREVLPVKTIIDGIRGALIAE
jgi:NAD(P)H-dependent flavin oxidoreductase YrpB (nitropropane dioxygenase family)